MIKTYYDKKERKIFMGFLTIKGLHLTKRLFLTLFVILVGSLLNACSSFNARTIDPQLPFSQTDSSTPTEENDGFYSYRTDPRLIVQNSRLFRDEDGKYYVTGKIKNLSDSSLTSIHIFIEIKDKKGKSILVDENNQKIKGTEIFPLMDVLAPGSESPFIYFLSTFDGIPVDLIVTVTDAKIMEKNPAFPLVKDLQIVNVGDGMIAVTGEILNTSDHWIRIDRLVGAVINTKYEIISTDLTGIYASLLAPQGDIAEQYQTPFKVSIPDPGLEFSDPKIFIDASVVDKPQLKDYAINITKQYFDRFGYFHQVGEFTNKGAQIMQVDLVTGLYDKDSILLDVNFTNLPYLVQPGDTIPFAIGNFNLIDQNVELAKRINSYSIQLDKDPNNIPEIQLLTLIASKVFVTKNGSSWNFQGVVTNTSSQKLLGEIIFVSIFDGSGNLSASGYTYVFSSGDSIQPGETNSFSFFVELDPEIDTSAYTYKVQVQGDLK